MKRFILLLLACVPVYGAQVLTPATTSTNPAVVRSWLGIGDSSGDFSADGSVPMTGPLNLGGNVATNGATPTRSDMLSTKGYTDTAIQNATNTLALLVSNYFATLTQLQAQGDAISNFVYGNGLLQTNDTIARVAAHGVAQTNDTIARISAATNTLAAGLMPLGGPLTNPVVWSGMSMYSHNTNGPSITFTNSTATNSLAFGQVKTSPSDYDPHGVLWNGSFYVGVDGTMVGAFGGFGDIGTIGCQNLYSGSSIFTSSGTFTSTVNVGGLLSGSDFSFNSPSSSVNYESSDGDGNVLLDMENDQSFHVQGSSFASMKVDLPLTVSRIATGVIRVSEIGVTGGEFFSEGLYANVFILDDGDLASGTFHMPSISSLNGERITIFNDSSGDVTLTTFDSSDNFQKCLGVGTSVGQSVVLADGDYVEYIGENSTGSGYWWIVSGTTTCF